MNLLFPYSCERGGSEERLVDITEMAVMAGINKQTFITKETWDYVIDVPYHNVQNRSVANHLWDVVLLFYIALESYNGETASEISYEVAVFKNGMSTEVKLKGVFWLGLDGQVYITIMLAHAGMTQQFKTQDEACCVREAILSTDSL